MDARESTERAETRVHALVVVGIIAIIVSSTAVSLRLWWRWHSSDLRFWWDDWFLAATTITSHILIAVIVAWTHYGLGQDFDSITASSFLPSLYFAKFSVLLYSVTLWLIKMSALLLYARIFGLSDWFRRLLRIFGVYVTLWSTAVIVVPWFDCVPVRKTLDPSASGVCYQMLGWYYAAAIIDALTDLLILLLPMPLVWHLKAPLRRKLIVTAAFVFGYCSAVLSFVRFVKIVHKPNLLNLEPSTGQYYQTLPLPLLSMLQAPLAIIAICGPSIGQSVVRVRQRHITTSFSRKGISISSSVNTCRTYNSENDQVRLHGMKYDEHGLENALL
ncbi:hypothetical protein F5Y16DRAFT_416616 [Xylariaceae sp. FL0255]|nr:hypothetical protein F5Y16DRAFT_416616 [Xylariaceae sp. FL0255]